MTRNQTTALMCIAVGIIAILIGYSAFVIGFTVYQPSKAQKTIVEPVNASQIHVLPNTTKDQAYNDSVYFLQPTVNVQGTYNDFR